MRQPTQSARRTTPYEAGRQTDHPHAARRPLSTADLLADYRAAADGLLERLHALFPRGLAVPLPDAAQGVGSLAGFVIPDALMAISLLVRDEGSGKIYTVPLAALVTHKGGAGAGDHGMEAH